jgi:hypothetical protein
MRRNSKENKMHIPCRKYGKLCKRCKKPHNKKIKILFAEILDD